MMTWKDQAPELHQSDTDAFRIVERFAWIAKKSGP
jgi:hypothetical protein